MIMHCVVALVQHSLAAYLTHPAVCMKTLETCRSQLIAKDWQYEGSVSVSVTATVSDNRILASGPTTTLQS
jgi:hypothetical protein